MRPDKIGLTPKELLTACTPKFNGWSNPQAVLIAGNDGTEYVRNVLVYSYTMFKKYVKFRIIILYVCIFRLFLCLTKIQKLQQIAKVKSLTLLETFQT